MPNTLFDILKKAFFLPKEKQKYLVLVNEKCIYSKEENPEWEIVESDNKVKKGMHRSYDCNGYDRVMSVEEQKICDKCGYRRTIIITEVLPYSYKKANELKANRDIKSLKELL
jgi:hypothetical protein